MLSSIFSPYVVGVLCRAAAHILAFLGVVIASRFIDLDAFGVFALAWAMAVIANTFVYTGCYHALLRSEDLERDAGTLFVMKAFVGLTGAFIIALVGHFVGGLETRLGFACFALAPLPLLGVPAAWLEARLIRAKRVRASSVAVLAAEACGFVATVIALLAGSGITGLIIGRLFGAFATLCLNAALARALPRPSLHLDVVRRSLRTALPIWATSGVGLFGQYGTDLILGMFLKPVDVGAFRGGARIASTVSDLVQKPIYTISWAKFARFKPDDRLAGIRAAWLESMRLSMAVMWPIVISIAILAEPVVVTVFDESWRAAAPVLSILSLSIAVRTAGLLLGPSLVCLDRGGQAFRVRLLDALVLLALLLLIGRFGLEEAALCRLLGGLIFAAIALRTVVRVLSIGRADLVRTVLPGLLLTLLCVLIIAATTPLRTGLSPGLGLLATIGILAIGWGSILIILVRNRILVIPKP